MNLSPLEWGLSLALFALIAILLDLDGRRWDAVRRAKAADQALALSRRDLAALRIRLLHESTCSIHDAAVVDTRIGVTVYEN